MSVTGDKGKEIEHDKSSEKSDTSMTADYVLMKQKCLSLNADVETHESISDISDKPEVIETDIKELERMKDEYSNASITLITLASNIAPHEMNQIEEQRKAFLIRVRKIRNQLLERLPVKSSSQNTLSQHSTSTNVKLPKIDIPKFSGTFADWSEF